MFAEKGKKREEAKPMQLDEQTDTVIDTPPMSGENKKLTSFRLSEELKVVLEQAAEEKGVTMTELVEIGAEIMSYLPPQILDTLKYNERRTQRQLSPAQQIVDVLCFKYSAPLMKWGRDNKGYLRRTMESLAMLDEPHKGTQAKLEGVEP